MGVKIFGFILFLLGAFFTYGVVKSSLPLFFGDKVKGKIVGMHKEKSRKHKPNSSYVYYPILEFEHENKTIKLTNNFQHDFKPDFIQSNTEMTIYYSKKYGSSNGFTFFEGIFLFIGLSFLFFGVACFFINTNNSFKLNSKI